MLCQLLNAGGTHCNSICLSQGLRRYLDHLVSGCAGFLPLRLLLNQLGVSKVRCTDTELKLALKMLLIHTLEGR